MLVCWFCLVWWFCKVCLFVLLGFDSLLGAFLGGFAMVCSFSLVLVCFCWNVFRCFTACLVFFQFFFLYSDIRL